jgi:hypothetical protein
MRPLPWSMIADWNGSAAMSPTPSNSREMAAVLIVRAIFQQRWTDHCHPHTPERRTCSNALQLLEENDEFIFR